MHHQAETGIWHCDMTKKTRKKQNKKIARNQCNVNWQGSRRNDMEAVNQAFGTNEGEIKQKSLEAIRLLRQDDHVLHKIQEYIDNRTVTDCVCVRERWSTNTRGSTREELEMFRGEDNAKE